MSFVLFNICSDGSRGGGGDFFAGFLLGGAVFGTLAYVFAPQVIGYPTLVLTYMKEMYEI